MSAETKKIRKLVAFTDNVVEFFRLLCVVISILFLVLMFIQGILRYGFSAPLYGVDEFVTCLMVWYCCVGSAIVFWEEAHAMIVYFLKFFPKRFRWTVEFCENVLIFIGAVVYVRAGILLFALQSKTMPIGGLPFSRAYYSALPITIMGVAIGLLEIVRFLRFLLDREDYESRERKGDN